MRYGVIATRFSDRPDPDNCHSHEKQLERCREYCEKNDIVVPPACVYHDKAVSGIKLKRPELEAAIAAIIPGHVMVIDRADRLARDMLVALTIRARVKAQGGTIEYADGSPAGATPEEEFCANIFMAMAQYERARTSKWSREAAQKKALQCIRVGKIPIGWMLDQEDDTKVVRCKIERDAIIEACRLQYTGWSWRDIAEKLSNKFGYCRGKPWSARTIRRVVPRERYWACPHEGDLSLEPITPARREPSE